jgi:hypothetical protein
MDAPRPATLGSPYKLVENLKFKYLSINQSGQGVINIQSKVFWDDLKRSPLTTKQFICDEITNVQGPVVLLAHRLGGLPVSNY